MVIVTESIIDEPAPLQTNYVPAEFINRQEEQSVLTRTFSHVRQTGTKNLVLSGPRGAGKTHLVLKQLRTLSETVETCYVDCREHDTQYKVLSKLFHVLFDEEIDNGFHTAGLQQELSRRRTRNTVLVLDELEFLMFNDGDDLLYYLSRDCSQALTLVLITTNDTDLESSLEERTYSSLHPQRLTLDSYSTGEIYDILAARARQALNPRSLHYRALEYIATSIANPRLGLHWLQTAAEAGGDHITEQDVKQVQLQGYHRYIDAQLEPFTLHHRLVYHAIKDLTSTQQPSVRTGHIYDRYRRLCKIHSEEPLSRRRISDFLKHLELLTLINVDYHYGGKTGRTREVQLTLLQ